MSTATITKPKATDDSSFGRRRSLRTLAGGSATTMLGRVLRETGRKSIEVAAFGSSV